MIVSNQFRIVFHIRKNVAKLCEIMRKIHGFFSAMQKNMRPLPYIASENVSLLYIHLSRTEDNIFIE